MVAGAALPTAVILAAGAGTRIGAPASRVPKPLTNLLGISLLARALQAAHSAGLRRAVVVTGYCADQVEAHARRAAAPLALEVDVVRNERWRSGNGSSLLAAETAAGDRAIVMMADHLIPPSFLRSLAGFEHDGAAGLLLVDDRLAAVHDLAEATKVRLVGSRIAEIGKHLDPFDAVDTGVFSFDRRIFEALRAVQARHRFELSAAVQRLADAGLMCAVRSDGSFWCDVDTPEDLAFARRQLEHEAQRAIIEVADGTAVASA